MTIKEIFSGKIAAFMYGIIISFIVAFNIIDTIYKERINQFKHGIEIYREDSAVCKDSLKQTKGLLEKVDIKSLLETNKSQQEIISKALREKKNIENELQKLRKEIGKHSSPQLVTLGYGEIFSVEGEDITSLVNRIKNLINECRKSYGGMIAKLNEYKNLIKRLKEFLPNDSMIQNIEPIKGKIAKVSAFYYREHNRKIKDDIEVQLVLIFNYLKEEYKQ